MSWCWKRKRTRCFDHQTLLKERARVTGIEIDLLNLRFLLSTYWRLIGRRCHGSPDEQRQNGIGVRRCRTFCAHICDVLFETLCIVDVSRLKQPRDNREREREASRAGHSSVFRGGAEYAVLL